MRRDTVLKADFARHITLSVLGWEKKDFLVMQNNEEEDASARIIPLVWSIHDGQVQVTINNDVKTGPFV